MPHTDGGKTLSRVLNSRPWSSSPKNKILHNASRESLSQVINLIFLFCLGGGRGRETGSKNSYHKLTVKRLLGWITLKRLGVVNWRRMVLERNDWRELLKQAKTQPGL